MWRKIQKKIINWKSKFVLSTCLPKLFQKSAERRQLKNIKLVSFECSLRCLASSLTSIILTKIIQNSIFIPFSCCFSKQQIFPRSWVATILNFDLFFRETKRGFYKIKKICFVEIFLKTKKRVEKSTVDKKNGGGGCSHWIYKKERAVVIGT